jgi:3-oxoacyl-[acyl-carrier protein] reductase
MTMDQRANHTLVLTGGLGSLGQQMIPHLVNSFERIFVLDRASHGTKLDERVEHFEVDLLNVESTRSALNQILSKCTAAVTLVNLAGQITNGLLLNPMKRGDDRLHSLELWNRTIESNLTTTFIATSQFVDALFAKRMAGNVVNVSSISAKGNLGQSAYSASKAGVEALTRVWAKELAPLRIRCNCIAPGFFDVGSTHAALSEPEQAKIKSKIPLKKFGDVKDLVSAIVFCASNDYLNGEILSVDGGIVL